MVLSWFHILHTYTNFFGGWSFSNRFSWSLRIYLLYSYAKTFWCFFSLLSFLDGSFALPLPVHIYQYPLKFSFLRKILLMMPSSCVATPPQVTLFPPGFSDGYFMFPRSGTALPASDEVRPSPSGFSGNWVYSFTPMPASPEFSLLPFGFLDFCHIPRLLHTFTNAFGGS